MDKTQIIELINTKPKHFSQIIQKDQELWSIIKDFHGITASEKIYNYLYEPIIKCEHGNLKKFKSIFDGYVCCGHSSVCKCAANSVAKKVSIAKKNYDDDTKVNIRKKREKTNIEKYGVANTGQLQSAIETRKNLYADKELVDIITNQVKNTKKEKYGNPNYNNPLKIKETFRQKDVDYWCQRYDNSNLKILNDKEKLAELYTRHSIAELSDMLGVHVQTIYRYLNKFKLRDPFSSSEELEVVNFLKSLGISNIIRNTRKLLPSEKEIDIYLPDFSIAIEYNGIYWHHEDISHITRNYHAEKYFECRQLGIQLITIFSNFWKSKKDLVKKILINKLGLEREKILARKCKICIPEKQQVKDFLNNNHIQGYTTSSIQYGLQYNDELVGMMTFGKTRLGIGKRESGYELIRYASSNRIVGGAGKLLNCFIEEHNPKRIISYSNNEWSNGNLYKVLGFTLEKEVPASYWYLFPRREKLIHRFNFAKQKLIKMGYDQALTERQITKEMGLLKVWDCGKKKWALTFDE